MPSALNCERSAEDDLDALRLYARTYKGKEWVARTQSASHAATCLEAPFRNYGNFYEKPRRLFQAKVRAIASFLHDLYDSKAGSFQYIGDLRNYEKFGACPYCGLPKNLTVDHYLPRKVEAFPHLSFLSLNLVPACTDCQGSKGSFYPEKPARVSPAKIRRNMLRLDRCRTAEDRVRKARRANAPPVPSLRIPGPTPLRPVKMDGVQETRRIIHPYLDDFLRRCVFDLALAWSRGQPEIDRLLWRRYLTHAQRALVAFHVAKLKVKERSRGIIRRRHQALVKAVVGKNLDRVGLVEKLKFKLTTVQGETGLANSMEAKYLEALLRDPSAISRLVTASAVHRPQQLTLESTAQRNAVRSSGRRPRRGRM